MNGSDSNSFPLEARQNKRVIKPNLLPMNGSSSFLFLAIFIYCLSSSFATASSPKIKVGIDRLMEEEFLFLLKGKRIGLIANHTSINNSLQSTAEVLKSKAAANGYSLVALFAPEHGFTGAAYAYQSIDEAKDHDNVPIYSLYGKTERPTDQMLKNIDLLIFDIQDIGTRSYTYIATMFYAMEEAAKHNIAFMVLDRPNPINGLIVDGPLLEDNWRSSLGYVNVPYCHGMTVGELARFFNEQYDIQCQLEVIPMKGWQRWMTFTDTGLTWIPTSPYIPEPDTPFFYPTTGILGELRFINIGIGYTLPFKLVGAPWIDAKHFAEHLNAQKFPGVHFRPFYYTPVYGRFAKENCQGVLIVVTDEAKFKPVSTQYLLLGMLKSLYPEKFNEAISAAKKRKETICKLNGTEQIYHLIVNEKYISWKLCEVHAKEREAFIKLRKRYLINDYGIEKPRI